LFIAACTSRNKQDWNSFQLELGLPAKFHGKNHMTETANIQIIKKAQLECGPMPNLMVALPNIGGALCSTPQSLADAHY